MPLTRQALPTIESPLGAPITGAFFVSATASATLGGDLPSHFFTDFYYRIWVVPLILEAQNPSYGVPIPFVIWNAYPTPATNTFTALSGSNIAGLDLTFDVGDTWRALEEKSVGVIVTPAAPLSIEALLNFEFTFGTGLLDFRANISNFISEIPETPVVETWEWATDIMRGYNGLEQRVALRGVPRRSINAKWQIRSEDHRLDRFRLLFRSLAGRLLVPYWQYATQLTAPTAIGDSELFFDPALTDTRETEFVLLVDPSNYQATLGRVETLTGTGALLAQPAVGVLPAGMFLVPTSFCRVPDGSSLAMRSITGSYQLTALEMVSRTAFTRPGSTASIETFDGFDVLNVRPLAGGDVPESFDQEVEVFDNVTGVPTTDSAWPRPYITGRRRFNVERPADLDFWRDFLFRARGQQNPFLLSTFLKDLPLVQNPDLDASTIIVSGTEYGGLYFVSDTYKRFRIELTSGAVIYRKAQSVVNDPLGQVVSFTEPFATIEETQIRKISFLLLVRLAEDRVTLTHQHTYSEIELSVRTIEE
jgi:hypothetical protein